MGDSKSPKISEDIKSPSIQKSENGALKRVKAYFLDPTKNPFIQVAQVLILFYYGMWALNPIIFGKDLLGYLILILFVSIVHWLTNFLVNVYGKKAYLWIVIGLAIGAAISGGYQFYQKFVNK